MTRPAVIIGLGGTGQWVLTFLKKDLMELNDGKMPDNVRLLAFDTVSEVEAERQVVGATLSGDQVDYEKAPKRIGAVTLEKDVELSHIGGDCKPLAERIMAGRYPHMRWFDAEYWNRTLTRDNWILDRGAGRFRQFGLLAVYKDLLGGHVRSQILKRLPNAIKEVLATIQGEASFEVIVVSSVAGGTGSAMLTPFGVLARKMAGHMPIRTRAIVVLPTAFSPGRPSEELELRGGATLRELARAMMVPEGYVSRITLVPGNRELDGIEYSRPFDGIYFIDGMREGQPLTADPKHGVFPAAAAWIRQILDDKSGVWFTNYVSTNRAGAQMNDPKRLSEGVFGVFGVYSLYTPERTLKQTYQLKLADRVLRALTDPLADGAGGRLIANPAPKGAPLPTSQSLNILTQPVSWQNEQQTLTPIFSEIAHIIEAGGPNAASEVDKYARAGLGRQRLEGWLPLVTGLPEGARFENLSQDVQAELGADFNTLFPPSDSYKPPRDPSSQEIQLNINRNIPAFLNEHYGGMGADGAEDYGSFGEVARQAMNAHIEIFREALRLNVKALLEENQGRGRLGYTISVLKALEKQLDIFLEFLKAVERKRGQIAKRGELDNDILARQQRWQKARSENPTLLERLQRRYSAKAVQAEKVLLAAHARRINYVREEVLHLRVKQLANAILAYVHDTRVELERWEAMLLEGDRAQDIPGLLRTIDSEKNRIITTVRADQRSEEVETLVQVHEKESSIDPSDIDWALEGIHWQIEPAETHLTFDLKLEPQGVEGGELQVIRPNMSRAMRLRIADRNMAVLGRVLEQRFGQIDEVVPMLKWCENTYPSPKDLAEMLTTKTTLLTSLNDANPGMESFSISINKAEDPAGYTVELEEYTRQLIAGSRKPDNNYPVAVLDCEDPYRLTAVHTQVGLMLEEFSTWWTCEGAYRKEMEKAEGADEKVVKELIQTLQSQFTQPEEKEAIAIEVRWRAQGRGHRVLHPRLVSLLGQRRRLELALQCWALGWVKLVIDEHLPDHKHWILQVPGQDDFWLTPNKRADEAPGDFEALESFVLVGRNHARDRRDVRLDWSALQEALLEQWKTPEGEDDSEPKQSPLCAAIKRALAKDTGLVDQWMAIAGQRIDMQTDNVSYRNPVYRDLSDYARDYFESIPC
ncbi:MAG: hypothetical protein GXP38_08650 [Chloroflexi bacterium]|nr:hypothetical protein [Chloroflexota bacterium]